MRKPDVCPIIINRVNLNDCQSLYQLIHKLSFIITEYMNDLEIEQKLADYAGSLARQRIEKLEINDERLVRIIDQLGILGAESAANSEIFTDEQAKSYFIEPTWAGSNQERPNLLRPETVTALTSIAQQIILTLAHNDDPNIQQVLYKLSHNIWPLYSRHSRTDAIGFDLQEYADFFKDISAQEKQELAQRLLKDWGLNK
jgi:hypothetical protein